MEQREEASNSVQHQKGGGRHTGDPAWYYLYIYFIQTKDLIIRFDVKRGDLSEILWKTTRADTPNCGGALEKKKVHLKTGLKI